MYYGSHGTSILAALNSDRENEESYCDITLKVSDKTFLAHKCILGKLSPFLHKMFKSKMKENYDSIANIQGISAAIFEIILDFFYTTAISVIEENVFELLKASDYLQLDELKAICGKFLVESVDPMNCLSYLVAGQVFNCEDVCNAAVKIAALCFEDIAQQDEFLDLERGALLMIVQSVNQEEISGTIVYKSCAAWTEHDFDQRKYDFVQFLKVIDFKALSASFIEQIVTKEALIKDSTVCKDYILSVLLNRLRQNEVEEIKTQDTNKVKMVKGSASQVVESNKEQWQLQSWRKVHVTSFNKTLPSQSSRENVHQPIPIYHQYPSSSQTAQNSVHELLPLLPFVYQNERSPKKIIIKDPTTLQKITKDVMAEGQLTKKPTTDPTATPRGNRMGSRGSKASHNADHDWTTVQNTKPVRIDPTKMKLSKNLESFYAEKNPADSSNVVPQFEKKFHLYQRDITKQLNMKKSNHEIFDWIEANLSKDERSKPAFLRALTSAVCQKAIIQGDNQLKLDKTQISVYSILLRKYLDDESKEVQAVCALQKLVMDLDQPANMLELLFDTLYDEEVISEQAFFKWEELDDPNECEGKGVALLSVKSFITWLHQADPDSDE